MGRTGTGLVVLGAALLVLLGCKHDDTLKPPKQDPVYNLPPASDPRYSGPVKFPDSTLNKFPKHDVPTDSLDGSPAAAKAPRPGMGGMSGPGMSGGY
jgi:hypothetical protein